MLGSSLAYLLLTSALILMELGIYRALAAILGVFAIVAGTRRPNRTAAARIAIRALNQD